MAQTKKKHHGSGKRYVQKPVKYDPLYTKELREELRKKLREHLTLAELAELQSEIRKAVEKAQQLSVIETHNRTWAIVFRVLHDRFGFETEQKQELYSTAIEYLEDIRDGRITAQELMETMENEDGIRLVTTWEDLER